ncbi:hypothetical protein RLOC_00000335 [Lonchura striata]|uniref:Uncharacterized protein n=1 Tax=Lonchura striata TaxID=40157 RepID=A0A218V6S5_9PASE|nr:hypothetical protein RLOC_00000335 [Lonchura striata domestica]
MELWLANTFLPLLLLIWLPVGTASQMVKPVTTVQLEIGSENLTAAPVTGTEDLTYANLKFEKKGTTSASSVIYTEIKPLQQKQSGGDGSAASTEVDVSPKEDKNDTGHCVANMVFRKSLVLDVLGGTCWP